MITVRDFIELYTDDAQMIEIFDITSCTSIGLFSASELRLSDYDDYEVMSIDAPTIHVQQYGWQIKVTVIQCINIEIDDEIDE